LRQQPATGTTRTTDNPDTQPPPKFAEYLLYLLLLKKDREPVLGDLEEEYQEVYNRFGKKLAIIWYYKQVGASYWPLITRATTKFLKWGVLGWIGDFIRRVIT
jgi:hypothetical protein